MEIKASITLMQESIMGLQDERMVLRDEVRSFVSRASSPCQAAAWGRIGGLLYARIVKILLGSYQWIWASVCRSLCHQGCSPALSLQALSCKYPPSYPPSFSPNLRCTPSPPQNLMELARLISWKSFITIWLFMAWLSSRSSHCCLLI